MKHHKIKIVLISDNKEKYIIKCLQTAGIIKYFESIFDKRKIVDHNGYHVNVMEYLVNVKYQIENNWVNFDNDNENIQANESKESKENENENESCKALYVDCNKSVVDKFYENPTCHVYYFNRNDDLGIRLEDMQSIAKKMGLKFDPREKWYM